MNILVTGANGFLGKNLISELKNKGDYKIFEYTRETADYLLEEYVKECEFVFHLAGVNRPEHDREFMEGNFEFTSYLLELLKKYKSKAPVLYSSSIHADTENSYGRSKKKGEEILSNYYLETDTKVYVYRLPNLFGKWSKPNYNSVVATYCHNVARGMDIRIENPDLELTLCYIDDVVSEFIRALEGNPTRSVDYCEVPATYNIKLYELATLIKSFNDMRKDLSLPNMENELTKKLYSTFLSFLPADKFSYDLKMNIDNRGSFTEFLRTSEKGQVSVNVSKPGITKGNHWHHTKNEKFLVVSGDGVIRFRKVLSNEIINYKVSGERLQVVDIPPGYVHSITNIGKSDLVTVMWANECFDLDKPDTYFTEV
ncbi:polysaccharide biosynthesis C-terminal domain-containing protein [Rossellomorea sp. H39__3]